MEIALETATKTTVTVVGIDAYGGQVALTSDVVFSIDRADLVAVTKTGPATADLVAQAILGSANLTFTSGALTGTLVVTVSPRQAVSLTATQTALVGV